MSSWRPFCWPPRVGEDRPKNTERILLDDPVPGCETVRSDLWGVSTTRRKKVEGSNDTTSSDGKTFQKDSNGYCRSTSQNRTRNRFILVVSDYATRYPEAVPLRNISAGKIAEVLIDIFARHGIPEEILTDQGTNFTSALLGELYRLMGIKALWTSPYHPKADGLVERFNQTLKAMLRKVLKGEKWDWDRMHATLRTVCLPWSSSSHRGFQPFWIIIRTWPLRTFGCVVRGMDPRAWNRCWHSQLRNECEKSHGNSQRTGRRKHESSTKLSKRPTMTRRHGNWTCNLVTRCYFSCPVAQKNL